MGLRIEYLNYINDLISKEMGDFNGISMLELGSQKTRGSVRKNHKTGKEYYESKGVNHMSIDLNGLHGSVKLDLSKPIKLDRQFDVVTNMGTTEHVEPYESQYECFENIHNFMKVGGIAIHIVPDYDSSEKIGFFENKHCNNYYTEEFFSTLSEENKYDLISNLMEKAPYRWVCYKKVKDREFTKNKSLILSKIVRREDGRVYGHQDGKFVFDIKTQQEVCYD